MALGTAVFAASPVLDPLPVIVISDEENNSTIDYNLFVFTSAFTFGDYVADGDTPDNQLAWSFYYDPVAVGNTGSLQVNNVGPLANIANATAPGASAISFAGVTYLADANLRETTLSPAAGSAPFPAPGTGTTDDVNNDGYPDKVVGELAVTFFVVDDQASVAGLDSQDTIVYTIDTNPAGTGAPAPAFGPAGGPALQTGGLGDALVDATGVPAIVFAPQPLVVTTAANALGVNAWKYTSWTGLVGTTGAATNWFWDATSATEGTSPFTTLNILGGTSTVPTTAQFGMSFGDWSNQGAPDAQYEAGNLYSVRATLGWAVRAGNTAGTPGKNSSDVWRIYSRENTLGSLNNSLEIAGSSLQSSPHLAAAGSTKAYQLISNPPDSELVRPSSGPNTQLFYTVGYDFMNVVSGGNFITARLSSFEIGEIARAAYQSNAAPVKVFGNGVGEAAFDGSVNPHTAGWQGWGVEQNGPAAFGLLGAIPASGISFGPGSVAMVIPAGNNLEFVTLSNFASIRIVSGAYSGDQAFLNDVGSLDGLIPDAVYMTESVVTNAPAAANRPEFFFRANYFDQAFQLKGEVYPQKFSGIERVTQAFPSGNNATFQLHFTAAEQFATTPGTLVGSEDDLQFVIGTVESSAHGGTVTLTKQRLILLGENDPNVDY